MVSFIHNESEITAWMGYSFKKHKIQSNIFKIRTYFLNIKLQIIRLAQGHWNCTTTHRNSYFYSYTNEKTFLAVHFPKGCQFVDSKVLDLVPKYYLLAGDTSQVFIFSSHKIKMSKQHRLFII